MRSVRDDLPPSAGGGEGDGQDREPEARGDERRGQSEPLSLTSSGALVGRSIDVYVEIVGGFIGFVSRPGDLIDARGVGRAQVLRLRGRRVAGVRRAGPARRPRVTPGGRR